MNIWSRYVRAVDRNLDDTVLNVRGWSSLVAVVPMGLFVVVDLLFQPADGTREVLLIIAIGIAAFLMGIWIWRILVALFGNPYGGRSQ